MQEAAWPTSSVRMTLVMSSLPREILPPANTERYPRVCRDGRDVLQINVGPQTDKSHDAIKRAGIEVVEPESLRYFRRDRALAARGRAVNRNYRNLSLHFCHQKTSSIKE